MRSLILATAARVVVPPMLAFSLFALLRGHNEPGGGFIGGLVAAAAFAVYMLAFGPGKARHLLRVDPRVLISVGLFAATASGLVAVAMGLPLLTGLWLPVPIPGVGKVGTPLLFDVGVFLVVVGGVLTMVFTLAED
jgi:multicomponent Na+:H+ antiporter subunit B